MSFCFKTSRSRVTKKCFEFRINTFELSSDVVEVKLGGKKAKFQALTQNDKLSGNSG